MKNFTVPKAEAETKLAYWKSEAARFGNPGPEADLSRPMNYQEIAASQVRQWLRFLAGAPIVQMDGAVARVA